MKIALVSQEYPPETARGGIGSQTLSKAIGLSNLGHDVFVISRSLDNERHEKKERKINVIRIPGLDNLFPEMTDVVEWLTHSIVIAKEIDELHKRISLDIIDFPEWAAEAYVHLLNRTEKKHIPAVIQLHGPLVMFAHMMDWPDMESKFYKVGIHMEATCLQLADAVYSSSKCSAEWVHKYYDYKKDIPVLHLGIDTKLFSPQDVVKNERPTIIFIGKIVPNKGVAELVEAACRLVKKIPRLRLRLIGRGDENYIKRLNEKAVTMDAPELLDFAGYVHKENLPAELSKAHVFAAPSYYEGGPGFVYLEAMACGLPVIGCSGSGVSEIVTPGENGILVPPQNINALEEALEKILTDKEFCKKMEIKAREYSLNEADSTDCIKKLEAYYLSIIKAVDIAATQENE